MDKIISLCASGLQACSRRGAIMRRMVRLLLTTLLFTITAQTVWADSYSEYITDVILVGGDNSEVNTAKSNNSGYTWISQDLNQGAGGDYIYLGYKTGSRASTNGGYITDFIVIDTSSPTSTLTFEGRTYYLCPYDGGEWFENQKGNLNSHCGDGWNLYLYYTKHNFSDKRAASSITINSTKGGSINCYYSDGSSHENEIDLNRGISGSSDVYMHFSTQTKKNRPASDPTMKTGLVYTGQPLQLVNYNPTSQCTMNYRVGTSGSYTSTVSDITATNAGTYTIYYYAASNSYGEYGPTFSQTVTIARSPNSGVTVSCADVMEGNTPQPTIGGTNLSTGAVTYKYSTSQNGSYSTAVPTSAGSYWVKATIASDANCNEYTTPAASFTMTPDWALHNSGDSEADAYVINTTGDLDLLAQRVNDGNTYSGKYFRLGADITYPHTSDWNNTTSTENNYTSIGSSYSFQGNFDGQGHTISGIRVSAAGDYNGLFGQLSEATVKNIILSDARIIGGIKQGGIAAYSYKSNITNCWVKSNVLIIRANSSNIRYVGGITGYIIEGALSGCLSEATLIINSSNNYDVYGGIITGLSTGGPQIRHCVAAGASVSKGGYYGAVVGVISGSAQALANNYYINCTVAGVADATNVGCNVSKKPADRNGARKAVAITTADGVTITPTGTATTYDVSGITAYEGNNGILYNGQLYAGATEQVRLTVSYAMPADYQLSGYTDGLGNALTANDDNTYTLAMTTQAATVTPDGTSLWGTADGADGSQQHPYVITTTAGLDLLSQKVNAGTNYSGKYFELGDNIAYDKTVENNFTPIGTESNYFSGHFDGKGHTVSGINISKSATDYIGLFGEIYNGAEIKNVTVDDSQIVGRKRCGGIVGRCQNSSVTNCHVTSNVTIHGSDSYAQYHGGIVGYNYRSQVTGCTSGANVTATSDLSGTSGYGGIVGYNDGGVENCLVYGGTINGHNNVGAVVGYKQSGTLSGTRYTGGVTLNGSQAMLNAGVGYGSQDGTAYACAIIPYEGVTLSFSLGTATNEYDYDGLKLYPTGMSYGGRYYNYIANDEANISGDVTFTATYTGSVPNGYVLNGFGWTDKADATNVTMNWAATDGDATCTLRTDIATIHYIAPTFIPLVELADRDADNNSLIENYNGQACNVQLTGRTLYKDGKWNTLCLPFNVNSLTGTPLEGATLMELDTDNGQYEHITGFTNGTLYLNFKAASSIVAGTPYIIKWDSGDDLTESDLVFAGVTVNRSMSDVTSTDGKVTFKGSYAGQTFNADDKSILFMGGGNTLYYPQNGASIGACRAYFQLNGITATSIPSNGVKMFFGEGDETTAVTTPLAPGRVVGGEAWYDLNGRRLSGKPTAKGIYINNGIKVAIK